jgi:hypothetical protein
VLVDGSRIEILFEVKTFLPPLLLEIDYILLATLRMPYLKLTNVQNSFLVSCSMCWQNVFAYLLLLMSSSLRGRFNS